MLDWWVAALSATLSSSIPTGKLFGDCGRYEANVAGIDAEDFPPIPAVSGGQSFSIPAGLLKQAINEVVFAAAPDDTRPVLAGVLLKMGGGTLTLAAADGFRLAVRTVELPEGGPDLQMIVPAKTLTEVARLLSDASDDQVAINTTPNGNQIYFAFGKTEITSRLIEGQFPDYQRIIPPDAKTKVKVSTTDFLRATRAAAVFARDNSMIVRLECSPAKDGAELALGSVLVKSTSAEMGDNEGNPDASSTATTPRSPSTVATCATHSKPSTPPKSCSRSPARAPPASSGHQASRTGICT